jgi:hypothetical protein
MAYNFRRGDRDQLLLLPPDPRDWLAADHLAWFVRDVVDQLDLGPFLCAYRADGHGHPAYDPKLLLGVLLYAYAQCGPAGHELGKHCRHACHPEATQGRAVAERLRFSVGGPLPGTAGGGRTRLRPGGRHVPASWTAACASAVGGPDLAKLTIGGNLGCRP